MWFGRIIPLTGVRKGTPAHFKASQVRGDRSYETEGKGDASV